MTLAIFIFSVNVPVWKDKLNICVIGYTIDVIALLMSLKSMSSQSVNGLLLQPFTIDITWSTGERNTLFLLEGVFMLLAKSGPIAINKLLNTYVSYLHCIIKLASFYNNLIWVTGFFIFCWPITGIRICHVSVMLLLCLSNNAL